MALLPARASLGKLVEQSVFTIMGRPNGQVVIPGDPALGGLPEQPGIGVLGEFIEADVAAIDRHGLGICGEGDDARSRCRIDYANFDLFSETGRRRPWSSSRLERQALLAMAGDGASQV